MPTRDTRWIRRPAGEEALVQRLSEELNINRILASLLLQRGVSTFDEAKAFFRPTLGMLHDPFLMKDMDKAVARLSRAVRDGEKILVYGDYDVDGTSAVALMVLFLSARCNHLDYYIPDRYAEGYGISFKGIDYAHRNGFSLVVALDCGIKANDKIRYAAEKGIDFIVCDHHLPGDALPEAVAVLDPKRPDCSYPFKELPGCGIGFKLAQAYALQHGIDANEVTTLIDLVAIAIAADIVPITGENRVLAWYGLKRINEAPRPGIQAILDVAQLRKVLTVTDVVFAIAPRINAAGRIESGRKAVELMIADNPDQARGHGYGINEHNSTRKDLDKSITEQALDLIRRDSGFSSRKSIVLYNDSWSKGVIGIVASRIADRFHRPTVILTKSGTHACGSARSVKDFDVYNAIERCSDVLEQFGGHMYAAGMTMDPKRVETFRDRFEEAVCDTIEEKSLIRSIDIDAVIGFDEITDRFFNVLKQFEPFGPGNDAPLFSTSDVRDTGGVRIVGNNHLKMTLEQPGQARRFDGIGFRLGESYDVVRGSRPFDVCYHIEENTFRDVTSLQLNIKDIRGV